MNCPCRRIVKKVFDWHESNFCHAHNSRCTVLTAHHQCFVKCINASWHVSSVIAGGGATRCCNSFYSRSFVTTLSQLETVELIKEAVKLDFFRLVEHLEHQQLSKQLKTQNDQK